MAIYSGFSREKLWFSTAMLDYQRVFEIKFQRKLSCLPKNDWKVSEGTKGLVLWTHPALPFRSPFGIDGTKWAKWQTCWESLNWDHESAEGCKKYIWTNYNTRNQAVLGILPNINHRVIKVKSIFGRMSLAHFCRSKLSRIYPIVVTWGRDQISRQRDVGHALCLLQTLAASPVLTFGQRREWPNRCRKPFKLVVHVLWKGDWCWDIL